MVREPRMPNKRDTEQYIRCALLGHEWEDYPQDEWMPDMNSIIDLPVSFRCVRCDTVKRELWGRNTGEVVSRFYQYNLGYTQVLHMIEYGENTTRRQAFRMEYERRFLLNGTKGRGSAEGR